MNRLTICRVCLNTNVSHLIPGTQLQEVYEIITSVPFQNTMKSSLMCYMCSAQLYKVHRLKLQCLKAEELLTLIHNQLLANKDGVQQESIEFDGTKITPFTCTAFQHIDIAPFPNVEDTICIKYEEVVIDVKTEVKKEEDGDEVKKSKDDTDSVKAALIHRDEVTASKCSIEIKTSILREGVTDREKHYKRKNVEKTESKYFQWSDTSKFRSNDEYTNSTCSENETQLICDICTKNFKSKCTLKRHIRSHTDERPYSCKICDKRFTEMGTLKRHEYTHTGERPYSCKICDKRFTRTGDLKTHEHIHAGNRPFNCKICDKRFTRISSLKIHERIHTGERRYSCKICDKRFTETGTLKRHERIHTGERPYICKICDKRFTRTCHLKIHEHIHAGNRPYNCKICDKRFTRIGNLKTHVRIHTGERPYSCKICDKRFTEIGNLKRHERLHITPGLGNRKNIELVNA